jgi:3-dehydroquinate dehydratase/shikimate dehydrogenase
VAKVKDATVVQTHSANTLIRDKDSFTAYNTDYRAALDSLLAHLPANADGTPGKLEKRMVLLVGAGGVARSVAHALHEQGTILAITNRTAERTAQLAAEVGARVVDWGARHTVLCDILINCTSVGMHPHVDESPIHASFLRPGLIVFDTIYTPETTLLVKEARARGCHVLTGVDMFVRQAALQFELFTGQQPPMELMLKLVKRALSPVALRDDEV